MKETENFVEWLTASLKSRHIKPVDLARGLDIRPSTITRWMQGSKPHKHTAERIRQFLAAVPVHTLPSIPKRAAFTEINWHSAVPAPAPDLCFGDFLCAEERVIVMRALSAAADRWREHSQHELFASEDVDWAADALIAESLYRQLAQ
jgi:hypothetical protein